MMTNLGGRSCLTISVGFKRTMDMVFGLLRLDGQRLMGKKLSENLGRFPAKYVVTFMFGYKQRNQNLKQVGARNAKVFIKQMTEMDGLNNLHSPSFSGYCRRWMLPLPTSVLIARYIMLLNDILSGNEMSTKQA